MIASLTGLLLLGAGLPDDPKLDAGYLWQPAFAVDTLRRTPAEAYEPQLGDLMICNARQVLWRASYRLALTGPPTHGGIVIRMADGRPGIVETGVLFPFHVHLRPIPDCFAGYDGEVYVRRRKAPLGEDESARLSEFARAVEGKRVAAVRFIGQATLFRSRGPLRTELMGKPNGIRESYICSELVIEALVYAGLLDADTARPAATYPADLFFERSQNSHLSRHLSPALNDGWHPPAYWTSSK